MSHGPICRSAALKTVYPSTLWPHALSVLVHTCQMSESAAWVCSSHSVVDFTGYLPIKSAIPNHRERLCLVWRALQMAWGANVLQYITASEEGNLPTSHCTPPLVHNIWNMNIKMQYNDWVTQQLGQNKWTISLIMQQSLSLNWKVLRMLKSVRCVIIMMMMIILVIIIIIIVIWYYII